MESRDVVCRFVVVCCMVGPLLPVRAQVNDPNHVVVTVVDRQGVPLAGVQVIECVVARQFTTDANGQFTCEPSQQVRYFYAVDKQRKLAEGERLEPGRTQLSITLAPAKVVSGRVTDPNGEPIAGVQIAALPMTSFYVLTNDRGEFDVGWLAEWEPGSGLCLMARHVERNLVAMVDISRQAGGVDIRLAPALSLSGMVTAADETPVPGATVSLVLRRWRWGCGTPVERTPVDETGHFVISTLPQLQEYELHARAPGYATEELRTGVISVVRDREEVGAIKLTRKAASATSGEMGRIRIRIVDEDLRPVDATVAQIWRKGEEGSAHAEDVLLISSITPGLYETDLLAMGKHHALSLNVEGFAPFWLPDIDVRKESAEPVLCRLSRGGTMEGLVIDEAGQPVMGVPVVINSILCRRDAVTDPNGRFAADHLPDARYSVIVEPESESPYATAVLKGGASNNAKDLRIVVKHKTEAKAVTSLVGRNLWRVDGLSVPLEPSQCRGKSIVVCFLDMEQRPSRRCLGELDKQAQVLRDKGIIVAAIQAAVVDDQTWRTWTTQNAIQLPLGRIERSVEEMKSAWGIRSLPWLILTDEKHVVRAEGFGVEELDSLIAGEKP